MADSTNSNIDIEALSKLIELKRTNNDEYIQFIQDMKTVMKDIVNITIEVYKELIDDTCQ